AKGASVCLIERSDLGGVCLNSGCMPTKAMLAASGIYYRARNAEHMGVSFSGAKVDTRAFMKRVLEVVAGLREASEKGHNSRRNVTIIRGTGRLTGPNELAVERGGTTHQVRARSIVIATGARPIRPDFLPWDSGKLMTTEAATRAEDLPESVVVMGGGVIGTEFACAYGELGIETHVLEMTDQLMPGMDCDAAKAVEELLTARGVDVQTGSKVLSMNASADGVTAELENGRNVSAACALIAVGRRPNVEDIGLEDAGVELADGIIPVDAKCRTNVENIYAVGDVAEKQQFAHLAERMGNIAGENATGGDMSDDRSVMPIGQYTHPEVAVVGLSEQQAREKYDKVTVARYSYANSGTGKVYDETDGQVKIVINPDDGRIYGAVVIGPHATDYAHELVLAMRHGITLAGILETIHMHPTFAEGIMAAAEGWEMRRIRKQARKAGK
ncbi:MAG: dihydrolipoyl dehydrogenase family protein, partial [Planctomycetota bacterium]